MAAKQDDALVLSTINELFKEGTYNADVAKIEEASGLTNAKLGKSIARLEKKGAIKCNTPRRKSRALAYMPIS